MASFDEVKLEDIVHDFFATYNPNTGANKNGDSLPTIAVYEEGNGTALTVTSSVTNVTTGVYRWQITVAAADGFEAGKYYSVWITATVTGTDTVTQSTPVMSFKATARVVDDLATPTNITAVGSVTAEVSANVTKINSVAASAVRLALSTGMIIPGTVSNAVLSPTTALFAVGDITEATATHYNGRRIIFTSGALIGQATAITGYTLVSGEGRFAVIALTEAPQNNDTFIIV